jgi:hypothetical protein
MTWAGLRRPHGQSPYGLQGGGASDAVAPVGRLGELSLMGSAGLERPHGQSPYGLQGGVASDALGTRWASEPRVSCAAEPRGVPSLLPAASLTSEFARAGDAIVENLCR